MPSMVVIYMRTAVIQILQCPMFAVILSFALSNEFHNIPSSATNHNNIVIMSDNVVV